MYSYYTFRRQMYHFCYFALFLRSSFFSPIRGQLDVRDDAEVRPLNISRDLPVIFYFLMSFLSFNKLCSHLMPRLNNVVSLAPCDFSFLFFPHNSRYYVFKFITSQVY